MLYRLLGKPRLRSGSRLHLARAWLISLLYERKRIVAWHRRHQPLTGIRYSWWDAWRATVENTPSFDRMWDEEMESVP